MQDAPDVAEDRVIGVGDVGERGDDAGHGAVLAGAGGPKSRRAQVKALTPRAVAAMKPAPNGVRLAHRRPNRLRRFPQSRRPRRHHPDGGSVPAGAQTRLKLTIDFGPEIGVKKSSAQITRHYTPETLVGRQVAAVLNFAPRQIGPFMSEVLTLGFPDADGEVVLIGPSQPTPNGGRLF